MRLKLDENLPAELATELTNLGHDVDTVPREGLAGHDDASVWQATQGHRRFFLTQDLDFSDRRRFVPGTHAGILVIRMREPTRRALIERVCMMFRMQEVADWSACFVVATDHRVRVRRPGGQRA